MSSTGEYQGVTAGPYIFTSNDYGITWIQSFSLADSSAVIHIVKISASGKYQIASEGSNLLVSLNYGSTWSLGHTPDNDGLAGLSLSSTGSYQAVASVNSGYSIFISHDFGLNWDPIALDLNCWFIKMSNDGKYLSSSCISNDFSGSFIYYSSDFGVHWSSQQLNLFLLSGPISMSDDGKYQTSTIISMLTLEFQLIFASSTYGSDWNTISEFSNNELTYDSTDTLLMYPTTEPSVYVSQNMILLILCIASLVIAVIVILSKFIRKHQHQPLPQASEHSLIEVTNLDKVTHI